MPLFRQGDNHCLFIHVPRTGGRYVTSLFDDPEQNIVCAYHKLPDSRDKFIRGLVPMHLHYPLYNFYFPAAHIPHITVVRHPYEKFVSQVTEMTNRLDGDYHIQLGNLLTSPPKEDIFREFIIFEREVNSYHINWFLPQYKFLSPKTNIWKYEWGFGEKFVKWVFQKTNIELRLRPVEYKRFYTGAPEGSTENKIKFPPQIKKWVKKYYNQDYKRLGYV